LPSHAAMVAELLLPVSGQYEPFLRAKPVFAFFGRIFEAVSRPI